MSATKRWLEENGYLLVTFDDECDGLDFYDDDGEPINRDGVQPPTEPEGFFEDIALNDPEPLPSPQVQRELSEQEKLIEYRRSLRKFLGM